jgi:hypothetical protein
MRSGLYRISKPKFFLEVDKIGILGGNESIYAVRRFRMQSTFLGIRTDYNVQGYYMLYYTVESKKKKKFGPPAAPMDDYFLLRSWMKS